MWATQQDQLTGILRSPCLALSMAIARFGNSTLGRMSERSRSERSSTIPTNWATAATNNKKKAQGRTPTHTGARSQVPDQKKPSRAQAHALKGEGKGELHAGCKGERGGDAHFPLQKRLMGNISNSFLIRCACSFNALESIFLKQQGY